MQAERKKSGKIMMCEACDHVFHFSHLPGSVTDCPSCHVTLYRARSNDFIATKHVFAEKKETPQLVEVIRPKFEKKLLLAELPPLKKEVSKRPKSIKVCDVCYSIQDVIKGEEERLCQVCFPVDRKTQDSDLTKQVEPEVLSLEEDIEYAAIDFEELVEEIPVEIPVPEEVFPEEKTPVIPQEQPQIKEGSLELSAPPAPISMTSFSLAQPLVASHLDFSEPPSGLAAPIFKKSETELSPAYGKIQLPEISGAIVNEDVWMNFKKQTLFTRLKDHLDYTYHTNSKNQKNVDTFNYQVRQVITRYLFLGISIVALVSLVIWAGYQIF